MHAGRCTHSQRRTVPNPNVSQNLIKLVGNEDQLIQRKTRYTKYTYINPLTSESSANIFEPNQVLEEKAFGLWGFNSCSSS